MEYGTGAVMSVPAMTTRFRICSEVRLPIRQVIAPITHRVEPGGFSPELGLDQSTEMKSAFTDYGALVNSGDWSGKLSEEAIVAMTSFAEERDSGREPLLIACATGAFHGSGSGCADPMIYCDRCGTVPVPEKDLPVELPPTATFTGAGESPLATVPEFVNVTCPNCGGEARRDTDTMDTFCRFVVVLFPLLRPAQS